MKTPFDSITPKLISQRKSVHELCRQFSRSPSKGNLKRLKALFYSCGENVFIEYGFHMDYGECISIGDRTFINANCTIIDAAKGDTAKGDANCTIRIGVDCLFGPNVQLLAVSHDMEPSLRLTKGNYADDIAIGNNVWLGSGVIVLGGVTIGDNSVVGAGSVVTKNIETSCFYAGNPAIKIRTL